MTPTDALCRAVELLNEDPSRREDLVDLLGEATNRSYSVLYTDVSRAVHAAVVKRYPPARVWVSADLWAALPDRTHEEVVAVLREAAASFEPISLGDAVAHHRDKPKDAGTCLDRRRLDRRPSR